MVERPLVGIITLRIIAYFAQFFIVSFLPGIAQENHESEETTRLIILASPMMACLCLPIYGSMMAKIGRKKLLISAVVLEIISLIMTMLSVLPSYSRETFIVMGIVIGGMHGIGSAGISCTVMAILSTLYKDRLAYVIGIQYTVIGVSWMFIPILWNFLYLFGDFMLWTFAVLLIFCIALAISILPKDIPYERPTIDVTWKSVLEIKTSWMNFLCIVGLTSINPILSTFLNGKLSINSHFVHPFFLINWLAYLIGTFTSGKLSQKVEIKVLLFAGICCIFTSLLLIGHATLLFIPPNIGNFVVSLVLLGFGSGFGIVLCLPNMIEDAFAGAPYLKRDHVADRLSALMELGLWTGGMVGPPFSGFLRDEIGLQNAEATIGLIISGYALAYAIFGSRFIAAKRLNARNANLIEGDSEMVETRALNSYE